VTAHGGLPFNLSAPFVFTPGVSVTHISETYGDLGKDLMSPIMPPGEADDPSAVDLGVLADLGWDVQLFVPVPEPSTISLMMAGFLAFGFMTLRRRQTSSI
jgi:PEP-CTERM motif-containing protein